VLKADEARALLDSIDTDTIVGLRDRALIALMCYTFARVGAVVGMKVEDYYQNGKRWWFGYTKRAANAKLTQPLCGPARAIRKLGSIAQIQLSALPRCQPCSHSHSCVPTFLW
jgi:integrase